MFKKLCTFSLFFLLSMSLSRANVELELLRELTQVNRQKKINSHLSNVAEQKVAETKFMLARIGLETSPADQNKIAEYTNNKDFVALSECINSLFIKTLAEGHLTLTDLTNNKPLAIAISGFLQTLIKDLNTNLQNDTQ